MGLLFSTEILLCAYLFLDFSPLLYAYLGQSSIRDTRVLTKAVEELPIQCMYNWLFSTNPLPLFLVSNREEDEDENEENDNRKNSNIDENGRGDRGHTNSNGNGNDDRHRRSDRRKRSDNHNKVMAPPSNGGTGMYLDSN